LNAIFMPKDSRLEVKPILIEIVINSVETE
jgi:hypothetical protein